MWSSSNWQSPCNESFLYYKLKSHFKSRLLYYYVGKDITELNESFSIDAMRVESMAAALGGHGPNRPRQTLTFKQHSCGQQRQMNVWRRGGRWEGKGGGEVPVERGGEIGQKQWCWWLLWGRRWKQVVEDVDKDDDDVKWEEEKGRVGRGKVWKEEKKVEN